MFQLRLKKASPAFLQWAMLALSTFAFLSATAKAQEQSNHSSDGLQIAITYDGVSSTRTDTSRLWLQGGSVEVHAPFYRGLGMVADVTGLHSGGNSVAAPIDLITVVFGPRYTFASYRKRASVFVEALAGEADGFHSIFTTGSGPVSNPMNGTTSSASGLAVQAGGGIDLKLSHRLSLRVIQAEYLRTQLPNTQTDVQNSLKLSAGIVLRAIP
jgi:hypothetical protein